MGTTGVLSRGNRLRALTVLTALLALAAYVPALGWPARYHEFTAGLAWGMGAALLVVAALRLVAPAVAAR